MKRNNFSANNYIRATLIKIKIPTEITNSFILRFDFNNQSQETEKLSGKEIELKKVISYLPYIVLVL